LIVAERVEVLEAVPVSPYCPVTLTTTEEVAITASKGTKLNEPEMLAPAEVLAETELTMAMALEIVALPPETVEQVPLAASFTKASAVPVKVLRTLPVKPKAPLINGEFTVPVADILLTSLKAPLIVAEAEVLAEADEVIAIALAIVASASETLFKEPATGIL
jgi:hypothetical protein